jgi:general secretion pathway protein F/type IV pilus assembly protein PilC
MIYLVPKFEDFYDRIEVPFATRVLLGMSNTLVHRWPLLLLVIAALVAGGWWLMRRDDVRRWLAGAQLRIPRLGPLVRDLAAGRFARVLGTLLANGIPMLTALRVSRDAAGNPQLADAIETAAEAVRRGEPLAPPLAESGFLSEDAIEVIAVGEAANNLPDVLITLAETLETRVDRQLTLFVRLMEPLLLLLLGSVVFFLFLALVVPMLKISSSF